MSADPRQVSEALAPLFGELNSIALELPREELQKLVGAKKVAAARFRRIVLQSFFEGQESHVVEEYACPDEFFEKAVDWEKIYRDDFGLKKDFSSGLWIPPYREGMDRLIVVAKEITPNVTFAKCSEEFPCWSYWSNLDVFIPLSDRKPYRDYAVWTKDEREAGESLPKELLHFSAKDLRLLGFSGITLLERLLYEWKYWRETEQHLDTKNWNRCDGSRAPDGYVPHVHWHSDNARLCVDWCAPGYFNDYLRSRPVVF